jgi:hypothetical protein
LTAVLPLAQAEWGTVPDWLAAVGTGRRKRPVARYQEQREGPKDRPAWVAWARERDTTRKRVEAETGRRRARAELIDFYRRGADPAVVARTPDHPPDGAGDLIGADASPSPSRG